jgi:hypothetical protein
MIRSYALSILALCVFSNAGNAQTQGNVFWQDSSIKVYEGGQQRQLAWCGGFSNPQFATADLNKDGLQDLVVYEWRNRQIKTFINKGTSTAALYVYNPHFEVNFPACQDYLKLEDYNRDGVPDLFHKGSDGFAVYKGYYNSYNELCFIFYKNLRYNSPAFGNINAYTQASDIPGIVDADGDGDLDFFGYGVTGSVISYFKNCQVEQGLPKDSIQVCNPSQCWGHVNQGFDRSYTLGIVSSATSPFCPTLGNFGCKIVGGQQVLKDTRHQGNCMLIFDADGDGDMDMLDGNISFSDLQYLQNGRAQFGGADSMISQDTFWQTGGKKLDLPQWPSPFYVDADGDGKKDILVSPHDFASAENYKTIVFYKNTGTAAAPVFTYQNDTFLVSQSVDIGTASYPVLYDYNKDGRLDLFVGSDGYYQPGGTLRSKISYYQNSVVNGVTRLTWQTDNFNGLFAQNFSGAAPAFGDLDGDGKDDMVLGHTDGTLSFYKNMAASNSVTPQWTLNKLMLGSVAGDTIDVGYSAAPFIYDINKDGKPDLLIGDQSGSVTNYQNTSTGGLSLTKKTSTLGGVKGDPNNNFSGFSSLYIGKMDNTNIDYLLSGNDIGTIVRYSGFQTGNVTTPYNLIDTAYSHIQNGARSTITVGDIDGDGKYEMILGNYHGGLNLYRQGPPVSVPDNDVMSTAGCTIYPNPARTEMVVAWDARLATGEVPVNISLVNMMGQVVLRNQTMASSSAASLNIVGLATGIYTCHVIVNGKVIALKVSIIR